MIRAIRVPDRIGEEVVREIREKDAKRISNEEDLTGLTGCTG
jgi:hypothetical protein